MQVDNLKLEKQFFTRHDVGEMLSVHPITIDRWVRAGKFPAPNYVINNRVKFWTKAFLDKYFGQFEKSAEVAGNHQ